MTKYEVIKEIVVTAQSLPKENDTSILSKEQAICIDFLRNISKGGADDETK